MKLLVLAAMLCSLTASGAAQESTVERKGDKPDLSGTWVWDKTRSNAEAVKRYGERGITLVVSHHDPELRVTRKTGTGDGERLHEAVYYTDGRGERNGGERDGQATDSKTGWKGDKIQRKYYFDMTMHGVRGGATKDARIEITDEWEVSKDGKHLTLTTTVRSAPGQPPLSVRPPDTKVAFTRS